MPKWTCKFCNRRYRGSTFKCICGKSRPEILTYEESILKKLEDNSIIDSITGCKLWQGAKVAYHGHGKTTFHNRTVLVHRLAMHLLKGFNLLSDIQINHKRECLYSNCWNIEHLYEGTQKDNMQDRRANFLGGVGH